MASPRLDPALPGIGGNLDQRLLRFVDTLSVCVGIYNGDGETVHLNRPFVELFGYGIQDMPTIEQWWQLAYPDPAYRAEVLEKWLGFLQNATEGDGTIEAGEYRVRCKDGSDRIVEISGSLVGTLVFGTIHDVTEMRETEAKLREQVGFNRAVIDNVADGICVCHDVEEFPYVCFTVWSATDGRDHRLLERGDQPPWMVPVPVPRPRSQRACQRAHGPHACR